MLDCIYNTLSITQINLKKKRNAWGTLLTNIHGQRNPIILARMPRKELLPSRSSFLRRARNFLKELPRNKDGEDLPRGTSLRRGGAGWRARKFLKERRGRMARIFLDARKFLASRKFLEIRMAIEELP